MQKFIVMPMGRFHSRVTVTSHASAVHDGAVPTHYPLCTATSMLTILMPLVDICWPEYPTHPAQSAAREARGFELALDEKQNSTEPTTITA